ncbi:MAG: cation-translocating P-type ATPase [Turicibacter sp.]|nr:cation-translocating P-type ATPase [Turicibacter sp.]
MAHFYQSSSDDVLKTLQTSEKGLTEQEIKQRQEQYGLNALMEEKEASVFKIFIDQFKDLLVLILIAAALISMLSDNIESACVILAVITLNAILGTVQTVKARKSLQSLKALSTPHTKVIRDGKKQEIPSTELTVGDIVLLEAGDVISADARLLQAHSLQVNESALTGEAVSVDKSVDAILTENCALGDQMNMVFSSGLVTYGRGVAVVTSVGMETEIGKIAKLMNETDARKTPLQRNLDAFSRRLSFAIIGICLIVFVLNLIQGSSTIDAMMFAVALAVAAIPEALASIVTIVLAIGTQKMAKENAIIKNINSVESLGSVSIICSDKTGTLTQNKMVAQNLYLNDQLVNKNELNKDQDPDRLLMLACGLCNDSTTTQVQRIGDPTELALVDLLETYGLDEIDLRETYKRLSELPFDSERKLMSTLQLIDGEPTMLVKGAPDELVARCQQVFTTNGIRPLSSDDHQKYQDINHQFAEQGLRVLGFAYKKLDKQQLEMNDESDLVLLGLISLMDPPRIESAQAVSDCKQAGIKPIMITGDHKVTAKSIATQIGIYEEGDFVLDGNELDQLSDEALKEKLPHISVYARVAPAHKIRIVKAWQDLGHIVAMTGDGVNDAPALKSSDIGIAMGITGTEVSKDAASMILTDDNFATIVKAVMTGRNVYSNIKNTITYLLSGNFSGIICVLFASIFMLPVPFYSVHLLFINLVTDSLPAIAIGMEKSTRNLLNEKPRDAHESILDVETLKRIGVEGVLIAIVTMIAYFIGLEQSHGLAATLAFATLCLSRLFHGFNCRSRESIFKIGLFSNVYSIGAFIIGFILLNAILLLPQLNQLFMVTEITMNQLGLIYLLGFIPTLIIQINRLMKTNK